MEQESSQASYGYGSKGSSNSSSTAAGSFLPEMLPLLESQNPSMDMDSEYFALCLQLYLEQQVQAQQQEQQHPLTPPQCARQQLLKNALMGPSSASVENTNFNFSPIIQNNSNMHSLLFGLNQFTSSSTSSMSSAYSSTPQQKQRQLKQVSLVATPTTLLTNGVSMSDCEETRVNELSNLLGALSKEDAEAAAAWIYSSIGGLTQSQEQQQQFDLALTREIQPSQEQQLLMLLSAAAAQTTTTASTFSNQNSNKFQATTTVATPALNTAGISVDSVTRTQTSFDSQELLNQFVELLTSNQDQQTQIQSFLQQDDIATALQTPPKINSQILAPLQQQQQQNTKKRQLPGKGKGPGKQSRRKALKPSDSLPQLQEPSQVSDNNDNNNNIDDDDNFNRNQKNSALIDEFTMLITQLLTAPVNTDQIHPILSTDVNGSNAHEIGVSETLQQVGVAGEGQEATAVPNLSEVPTTNSNKKKASIINRSKQIKKRAASKQSNQPSGTNVATNAEPANTSTTMLLSNSKPVLIIDAKESEISNQSCNTSSSSNTASSIFANMMIPSLSSCNSNGVGNQLSNNSSSVGFSRYKGSPEAASTSSIAMPTLSLGTHSNSVNQSNSATATGGGSSSCFRLKSSPMSGTNSAFKLRTECSNPTTNNNANAISSTYSHLLKSPCANSSSSSSFLNAKAISSSILMTPNHQNNSNTRSFSITSDVSTALTLPSIKHREAAISNIHEANEMIIAAAAAGPYGDVSSPIRCESFKIIEEDEDEEIEIVVPCYHSRIKQESKERLQLQVGRNESSALSVVSMDNIIVVEEDDDEEEVEEQKQAMKGKKVISAFAPRKGIAKRSNAKTTSATTTRRRRSEAERLVQQSIQEQEQQSELELESQRKEIAKKALRKSSKLSTRISHTRMRRDHAQEESVIKPAEENEELFGNMDAFSVATQDIIAAFEKHYVKVLQTAKSTSAEAMNNFKSFMKSARKNDEHIGLLLNPRVCIYSAKFVSFLKGPAIEWIRRNIDSHEQPIYIQLIQIFKSEDKGISGLRPRRDRNLLSNFALRK